MKTGRKVLAVASVFGRVIAYPSDIRGRNVIERMSRGGRALPTARKPAQLVRRRPDPSQRHDCRMSHSADPLFRIPVAVVVRRPFGLTSSGNWVRMKAGLAGSELLIFSSEVRVEVASHFGRWLMPSLPFATGNTTMQVVHLGWAETPLFRRDYIALSVPGQRGTEVALRPLNGDLDAVWNELQRVGVRPASEPLRQIHRWGAATTLVVVLAAVLILLLVHLSPGAKLLIVVVICFLLLQRALPGR